MDERVEILGVTHIAGMHHDEAIHKIPLACPLIVMRLRTERCSVCPVRNSLIRSRRTPLLTSRVRIVSPMATTRSARRSPNRTARSRARTSKGFFSRPSSTAISGKTSWVTTTSGTRCRCATAAPRGDKRWIGQAEHDIRTRERESGPCCEPEVAEVVKSAQGQMTAVESRGVDADDLDSVTDKPLRPPRVVHRPVTTVISTS